MEDAESIWTELKELGVSKWKVGQAEHGGNLLLKPVLDEALKEVLDLASYIMVLRRQVQSARQCLLYALDGTGEHRDFIMGAYNILTHGNPEGPPSASQAPAGE